MDEMLSFGSEKDYRLKSFLAGTVLPNTGTTDPMHKLFLTDVKPQAASLPVLGKFPPISTPTVFVKQILQKVVGMTGLHSIIDFLQVPCDHCVRGSLAVING